LVWACLPAAGGVLVCYLLGQGAHILVPENRGLPRKDSVLGGIEDVLLDIAREIYDAVGWPGVVFLMAIESACIPFPSEIIMPLAGWLLVADKDRGWDYLLLGAFYGALGNTIGSLVAYYAGAWGGRPLLERYGRYILITRKDVAWADRWFGRYGEVTVLASRMLPVIRTFISLPAGIARMNVARFTVLSFVGSYPWSLLLIFAGYQLGENWEDLGDYFRPVSIPLAIALVLGAVVFFYRRIREVRAEGHFPEAGEP
jgi:membrane protein DedA with SNARE-associated domain